MKGYGQFCPVAKASEILAERWTPLILRELLCGSHRFNDLSRGVPLMSRSLLAKRLRELERANVVERRGLRGDARASEYHLTPAGVELAPIIEAIGTWGRRWVVQELADDDLDPSLLMWDIRRNAGGDHRPDRDVVVRFELADLHGAKRRWWLLLTADGSVDLCMTDPGFDVDLEVAVPLRALTTYWLGQVGWNQLLRDGELRLDGPAWMRRDLPRWLGTSRFAEAGKAR